MTAAFDRSRAKYFHGRKQILRDFNGLLERAIQAISGTTFLVQGPQGLQVQGRLNFIYECEKLA